MMFASPHFLEGSLLPSSLDHSLALSVTNGNDFHSVAARRYYSIRRRQPVLVFMFHHSHSNHQCSTKTGDPDFRAFQCRPGCNSSMPTGAERDMPGYSWWWDLYNVSTFFTHRATTSSSSACL